MFVVFGTGDESRANRVEFDVQEAVEHGPFVFEQGTFEPVGPESAAAVENKIVPASESSLVGTHKFREIEDAFVEVFPLMGQPRIHQMIR